MAKQMIRQDESNEFDGIKITVLDCPRCGHNHYQLKFEPLSRATVEARQGQAQMWAMCPNENQPIMVRFELVK